MKTKTISKNRREITKILKKNDIDRDTDGLLIQINNDGERIISAPAPDGEPAHYNARTNTGGRRFICWA